MQLGKQHTCMDGLILLQRVWQAVSAQVHVIVYLDDVACVIGVCYGLEEGQRLLREAVIPLLRAAQLVCAVGFGCKRFRASNGSAAWLCWQA